MESGAEGERVVVVEDEELSLVRVGDEDAVHGKRGVKYWLTFCGLPIPFAVVIYVNCLLVIGGTIGSIYLAESAENTKDWNPSTCLIHEKTLENQCYRRVGRSCGDTANHSWRIRFRISGFSDELDPELQINAYYGPSNSYYMSESRAKTAFSGFKRAEVADCWVKPGNPKKVSMAYGVEDNDSAVFVLVLACTCTFVFTLGFAAVLAVVYKRIQRNRLDTELAGGNSISVKKVTANSKRIEIIQHLRSQCYIHGEERENVLRKIEDEGETMECSICLEDLDFSITAEPLDSVNSAASLLGLSEMSDIDWELHRAPIRVSCGHYFHEGCLVSWVLLGRRRVCPLCHYRLRNMLNESNVAKERGTAAELREVITVSSSAPE